MRAPQKSLCETQGPTLDRGATVRDRGKLVIKSVHGVQRLQEERENGYRWGKAKHRHSSTGIVGPGRASQGPCTARHERCFDMADTFEARRKEWRRSEAICGVRILIDASPVRPTPKCFRAWRREQNHRACWKDIEVRSSRICTLDTGYARR
ncbi:hypothetical protein KM043_005878 [Ampulex compressa]|nr:hypothetical protein KM043_005878 [Ampulex compressa]